MRAYDPAFAYEIAVIIQDGIRRMYKEGESIFYYLTVMNEPYAMPPMPGNVKDGILKGMYRFRAAANPKAKLRAQLFGSGAILNEALRAQEILEGKYGVAADVWSVTSYKALYTDGNEAERWNRLHAGEKPRVPYVTQCLADAPGVLVAASDYLKTLPNMVSRWMPRRLAGLGTDGFGRSESRASLRDFFEVDARFITIATLHELFADGKIERSVLDKAIKDLGVNPDKSNPVVS
jgi:pyruvate dehydrogenase E1 component